MSIRKIRLNEASRCQAMTEKKHATLSYNNMDSSPDKWQRWDEDLVEDFGRWLILIAKTFAVVFLLGSALILVTWLWKGL